MAGAYLIGIVIMLVSFLVGRQLRSQISNEHLAELVVTLHQEDKLCLVRDEVENQEPQIICSLGLVSTG